MSPLVVSIAAGLVALGAAARFGEARRPARRARALRHDEGEPSPSGWSRGPGPPALVMLRARLGAVLGRCRWTIGGTEAEHAELLASVARSLRAGFSFPAALEQAVTAGRSAAVADLDRALGQVRNGAPLVGTLDGWAAANDPVRAVAGAALALGAELGGARAAALDAAAAGLRDRAALTGEIRALTAQARASAAVMVVAPLGFALVSWLTGGAQGFATPLGLACVAAGVALDAVGAAWMAAWTRRVS